MSKSRRRRNLSKARAGVEGKPIEPGVIATLSGQNPSNPGQNWMREGVPLNPLFPTGTEPRTIDYPVGYNIRIQPRADETVTFGQLRALADNLDILRLVIETQKDHLAKLKFTFRLARKQGETPGQAKLRAESDPRVKELTEFFAFPDKMHPWQLWARMVWEESMVTDATTLYMRKDNGGKPYALEVIDGATITRKIDDKGRTPTPGDLDQNGNPLPAYQQIIKGMPAESFTTDELLYLPFNPRVQKFYGYSPVEQIITTVNIALRKMMMQLNWYTEGTIPAGFFEANPNWTPDQIKQFQQWFDSYLTFDNRSKMITLPAGAKPLFPKADAMKDEFDEWLARIVCYCFGVSATPLMKQMNRASAETTNETAEEEGLLPWMDRTLVMINAVVRKWFGYQDVEFAWEQQAEVDQLKQAAIFRDLVPIGVMGVDECREQLGLDPVGVGNVIIAGNDFIPLTKEVFAQKTENAKQPPPDPVALAAARAQGAGSFGEQPKPNSPEKLYRGKFDKRVA